jgi:hypothetical protein
MERALADGDTEVLAAVLGAPAMLSGLSKEMHAHFLTQFHQKREPEKAKRLRLYKSAKEQLARRETLVMPGIIKAVGTIVVQTGKSMKGEPVFRNVGPDEIKQQKRQVDAVYAKHA